MDKRIAELKAWERETGRGLPYMPATICALEDRGFVVDLESGEVFRPEGCESPALPWVPVVPLPAAEDVSVGEL